MQTCLHGEASEVADMRNCRAQGMHAQLKPSTSSCPHPPTPNLCAEVRHKILMSKCTAKAHV